MKIELWHCRLLIICLLLDMTLLDHLIICYSIKESLDNHHKCIVWYREKASSQGYEHFM